MGGVRGTQTLDEQDAAGSGGPEPAGGRCVLGAPAPGDTEGRSTFGHRALGFGLMNFRMYGLLCIDFAKKKKNFLVFFDYGTYESDVKEDQPNFTLAWRRHSICLHLQIKKKVLKAVTGNGVKTTCAS